VRAPQQLPPADCTDHEGTRASRPDAAAGASHQRGITCNNWRSGRTLLE